MLARRVDVRADDDHALSSILPHETAHVVLAGRFGGAFTYAAFNKERGVAPGILSFDELKNLYRYEEINGRTAFYGVVGDSWLHRRDAAEKIN